MKDFARRGGRLRALPLQARLVYTIFIVFTLAALALTAWLAEDMVGLDLAELGPYYAGEATGPAATPVGPVPDLAGEGGPSIELPGEMDLPAPAATPMSQRKLLEVTHFHLFSMPVYLLILSHLFMLSRARTASKAAWIVAGTVGVAGHAAAPWVAASSGSSSAWLYGSSGLLLGVAFLWMSLVPLWEMWTGPTRPAESANGAPPRSSPR